LRIGQVNEKPEQPMVKRNLTILVPGRKNHCSGLSGARPRVFNCDILILRTNTEDPSLERKVESTEAHGMDSPACWSILCRKYIHANFLPVDECACHLLLKRIESQGAKMITNCQHGAAAFLIMVQIVKYLIKISNVRQSTSVCGSG
jgi:hypothetical protein